jgi:site-specific recombinase XerD
MPNTVKEIWGERLPAGQYRALFCTAAARRASLPPIPSSSRTPNRIIRRRAKAAGIETRIGNHTFRTTGITAYLKDSGKLEVAQQIANHESPRTTKLYDRRHTRFTR